MGQKPITVVDTKHSYALCWDNQRCQVARTVLSTTGTNKFFGWKLGRCPWLEFWSTCCVCALVMGFEIGEDILDEEANGCNEEFILMFPQ